jgi:hypothetical protein
VTFKISCSASKAQRYEPAHQRLGAGGNRGDTDMTKLQVIARLMVIASLAGAGAVLGEEKASSGENLLDEVLARAKLPGGVGVLVARGQDGFLNEPKEKLEQVRQLSAAKVAEWLGSRLDARLFGESSRWRHFYAEHNLQLPKPSILIASTQKTSRNESLIAVFAGGEDLKFKKYDSVQQAAEDLDAIVEVIEAALIADEARRQKEKLASEMAALRQEIAENKRKIQENEAFIASATEIRMKAASVVRDADGTLKLADPRGEAVLRRYEVKTGKTVNRLNRKEVIQAIDSVIQELEAAAVGGN